jgi:hypothetical protein
MPGVFDRLQKRLDLEKRDEGISPLEIASLPPNLRKIMRLMLREVQIRYVDLCNAVAEMPEENRLSRADLDAALKELTAQNWLICRGEGDYVNYQVNLRRKAGSKIAQGVWANLNLKISQTPPPPPTQPVQQTESQPDAAASAAKEGNG